LPATEYVLADIGRRIQDAWSNRRIGRRSGHVRNPFAFFGEL